MSTFSIGKAAFSGFELIAKKPVLLVSVTLAYGLLNYLPVLGFLASGGSVPSFSGPGGSEAVEALIEQFSSPGAIALGILWGLSQLALVFVLQTAIYRAVIEPRNVGLGYLRLGMDELRQFVLTLLVILLFLPLILLVAFVGGAGAGLASLAPEGASGPLAAVAIAVAVVLAVWIVVRLCLAAPMTFAEKKIRLFESFRVTKGRFWKLVGLFLMLILLALALFIAIAVVFGLLLAVLGVGFMAAGGSFDWESLGSVLQPDLTSLASFATPLTLVTVVVDSLSNALLLIVFGAPLAYVYKTLTDKPE